MNWNLDELKAELKSQPKILGWILTEENTHRRERYFLKDKSVSTADQDREVHSQSVDVRLFVDNGKPNRQGEISKRIHRGATLSEQITSAVEAALQTDHQRWTLPAKVSGDLPSVKSFDPSLVEDLEGSMNSITGSVLKASMKPRETRFDSAELFLSTHEKELHLSNGLKHRSKKTRVYLEAAFSYADQDKSDEYLHTSWAVSPEDLSVEELFDTASDRARISLETEKPVTGNYWVILDAEVLSQLVVQTFTQFAGSSQYLSLPHKKPGEEWIPGAMGDLLTLKIDPTLEYGASSTALSDQGLEQKPLTLVSENKVLETALDQQYAQYLGKAATTSAGNLVLSAGSKTTEELYRHADQVLEILQFSGLFVDANSGNFASEIRLAKLHDKKTGKVKVIKGGSVSGSLFANFKEAYFSKECEKKSVVNYGNAAGYYGPKYALISNVSVVG
jgi:predicted Zn-dependent protease